MDLVRMKIEALYKAKHVEVRGLLIGVNESIFPPMEFKQFMQAMADLHAEYKRKEKQQLPKEYTELVEDMKKSAFAIAGIPEEVLMVNDKQMALNQLQQVSLNILVEQGWFDTLLEQGWPLKTLEAEQMKCYFNLISKEEDRRFLKNDESDLRNLLRRTTLSELSPSIFQEALRKAYEARESSIEQHVDEQVEEFKRRKKTEQTEEMDEMTEEKPEMTEETTKPETFKAAVCRELVGENSKAQGKKVRLTMKEEKELKCLLNEYNNDKTEVIDALYKKATAYGLTYKYQSLVQAGPKKLTQALINGYDVSYETTNHVPTMTKEQAKLIDNTLLLLKNGAIMKAIQLESADGRIGLHYDFTKLGALSFTNFLHALVNGYEVEEDANDAED